MKKRLFIIIAALILVASSAWAAIEYATSSGEQTSDTAITAGTGYITCVHIITDGTNDAKVIVYDNATAASGKVLFEGTIAGGSNFGGKQWAIPAHYTNGIYADVTGTGASYIIEYIPE